MNTTSEPRLGVDFGRVIQGGAAPSGVADTVFLAGGPEEAMRTPETPGMFDVLPELVDRFDGRAWIISKCGERIQKRTLQWLDHHDFYRRTGLPVRQRSLLSQTWRQGDALRRPSHHPHGR